MRTRYSQSKIFYPTFLHNIYGLSDCNQLLSFLERNEPMDDYGGYHSTACLRGMRGLNNGTAVIPQNYIRNLRGTARRLSRSLEENQAYFGDFLLAPLEIITGTELKLRLRRSLQAELPGSMGGSDAS